MPDFDDEDENVHRRIMVYTTKSLPTTTCGVDRWIYDHAVDCIAWIVEELREQRHLIESDELWFESTDTLTIQEATEAETLFDITEVRNITRSDLVTRRQAISAPPCLLFMIASRANTVLCTKP